jgi:hypothetical protein
MKSKIYWVVTPCGLVLIRRCSSETAVHFYQSTRLYIPEDLALHNYRSENLKSNKVYIKFVAGAKWIRKRTI